MVIIGKLFLLLLAAVRKCSVRQRSIFSLVLVFAALSPVVDLLLFKLVASCFSYPIAIFKERLFEFLLGLSFLAILNSLLKYYIKIKKIEYVNAVISIVHVLAGSVLNTSVNWLRMGFLETLNVFIIFSHILIITFFSFYLNPLLGFCLALVICVVMFFCSNSFTKEQIRQIQIRFNRRLLAKDKGEKNVESRVKTTEKLTFFVNVFIFLFFLVLIVLYINGKTNTQDGLIFMFIAKIIGSNLSALSGAIMRLARAWANIFDKYEATADLF